MSEALHRATDAIGERELPRMVLDRHELPAALNNFIPVRSGELDNATLAEQGLPNSSAVRFRQVGRLTGYLHEFASPEPDEEKIPLGYDLAAATVVHLFDHAAGVSRWIEEVFIGDFEARVDCEIHPEQRLLLVQRVPFKGFADEAAGLRILQSSPIGPIASTVVDFRVGRLLGVAYVATLGNYERQALVERLGQELERKMIRVVFEVPSVFRVK
jgi:hypothetical protein